MSLFGSLFGEAKDVDATGAPNELAKLSKQLFEESSPLRKMLIDQSMGFVGGGGRTPDQQTELSTLLGLQQGGSGGFDVDQARKQYVNVYGGGSEEGLTHVSDDWLKENFPNSSSSAFSPAQEERLKFLQGLPEQGSGGSGLSQSPMYRALKGASESQFNRARENILATTPRGGGLLDALSNLEGQKASTMTQGVGGLAENEMARAFALATGTTPTALGGLGSASSSLANIGAAQSAQQGQVLQGLGYGAGSYLASGKGASAGASAGAKSAGSAGAAAACWVAEVLFGMDSPKTFSIRRFVLRHMHDNTLFGAWCRVYSKHGKQWAQWVKKNRLVKGLAYMGWSMLYRLSK